MNRAHVGRVSNGGERMDVTVRQESGGRFAGECGGVVVRTGRGEEEKELDGMYPAEMFVASLGMCIGGYVYGYCKNHGIPCNGLVVEMHGERAEEPARLSKIVARVKFPGELDKKLRTILKRVADKCFITRSIEAGLKIECEVGESAG